MFFFYDELLSNSKTFKSGEILACPVQENGTCDGTGTRYPNFAAGNMIGFSFLLYP